MRRSAPWLTALLQTVILIAVVGSAAPWLDADTSSLPTPPRSGDVTLNGLQARPLYNGSVVPGGVYSIEELRAAIARDPIVAAHYGNIDLAEMRAVTLTTARSAYVSYRRGDRTYWTRHRVWLKAGETVLTDGATTIRARCGNCVSDVEPTRVAAVEPAHGELDDFVVPPTPESGVDAFAAEAEAGLGDLLEVPLVPQLLATLDPSGAPPITDLMAEHFDDRRFPFLGRALLPLPEGGSDGGGGGGVDGGDGSGSVPGGGTTTGDFPTGDSPTGSPTGATGDTLTTTVGVDEAAAVPEPDALWLLTCAVVGLASRRFRSR